MDPHAEPPPASLSSADRLDSWKAIAHHLGRDIRTVQRYEPEGLPVYRHAKHGSVYAYKSELESWWTSREHTIRQERAEPSRASDTSRLRRYLRPAIYIAVGIAIALSALTVRQLLFGDDQASAGALPLSSAVAVLPFDNISPNPPDHSFAQSFSQQLVANLRLQPSIRVLDPSSIRPPSGASPNLPYLANALHADQVLSGTISQQRQFIRITAELTNVRSGKLLWRTQYETESAEPRAFESGVARAVALGVKNALSVQNSISR